MSYEYPSENYPPSIPPTQYSQPGAYDAAQQYGQAAPGYGANPYGQQANYMGNPYAPPQAGYMPSNSYGQQYVYAVAPVPVVPVYDPNKGQAIAGMVLGILAICLFCSPLVGVVLGVLSLIFSIIGMRSLTGKGMAVAGLVLSILALTVSVLIIVLLGLAGLFAI